MEERKEVSVGPDDPQVLGGLVVSVVRSTSTVENDVNEVKVISNLAELYGVKKEVEVEQLDVDNVPSMTAGLVEEGSGKMSVVSESAGLVEEMKDVVVGPEVPQVLGGLTGLVEEGNGKMSVVSESAGLVEEMKDVVIGPEVPQVLGGLTGLVE